MSKNESFYRQLITTEKNAKLQMLEDRATIHTRAVVGQIVTNSKVVRAPLPEESIQMLHSLVYSTYKEAYTKALE